MVGLVGAMDGKGTTRLQVPHMEVAEDTRVPVAAAYVPDKPEIVTKLPETAPIRVGELQLPLLLVESGIQDP